MKARIVFIVASTLLTSAAQTGQAAEPAKSVPATMQKHIMITPADIKWGDCPPFLPAGAKCTIIEGDPQVANALFTIRSRLPNKYKILPHTHPTDEHVTVLSGTFKMGLGEKFDERALKTMGAGSFMVMPKGVAHFALTRGETIVQVHAMGPMVFTYINPADDPSKR